MLKVDNVSKMYNLGKVHVSALRDVSFEIESGEMVCIMGKSGSGKSTLLRQLSLIDRPTGGTIYIDNQNVTKLSEKKRSRLRLSHLGYVFQEYALIPELTAEENIYLPAMMLGSKKRAEYRKRAHELLELVGLSERVTHRPGEMSGGEQQRVAIARALINNPSIIYADEPTANLDTKSANTIMKTLANLNKKLGVTVLFVSHDPDDRAFAKRLIFLRDGQLTKEYL